jgi:predicted acetyltransferase
MEAAIMRSMPVRFERPHSGLADSWRSLVREFDERGEMRVPFPLDWDCTHFDSLVAKLAACARGEGLPEGFVPHSTFCLVEGGEIVAVANLRHRLTDRLRVEGGNIGYGVRPSARRRGHATEILRRTLEEARAVGLTEVLLTCAKDNPGSIGTILKCGGRYEDEEFIESRGKVVQRYWIGIPAR